MTCAPLKRLFDSVSQIAYTTVLLRRSKLWTSKGLANFLRASNLKKANPLNLEPK